MLPRELQAAGTLASTAACAYSPRLTVYSSGLNFDRHPVAADRVGDEGLLERGMSHSPEPLAVERSR
jgi:hypothetical protein